MHTTELRPEMPPLPDHMKGLKTARGYPVPWFVTWLNDEGKEVDPGEGYAEFRVMSQRRWLEAVKRNRCWICGGELGKYRTFAIGPMCLVNRINAEPPSHTSCAEFAVAACPFMVRPHMVRREAGMPEGTTESAGQQIMRNPGVMCLYTSKLAYTMRGDGKGGVLIGLPEPTEVRFFAEGRPATREEVETAVETGLPSLFAVCVTDQERAEVRALADKALRLFAPPVVAQSSDG